MSATPVRSLPLVFDKPSRGRRAPRHLADMTLDERRELIRAAGLPAFRAAQVSQHYFARLVDDVAAMTDLPADSRRPLAEVLLPKLLEPVTARCADGGATRKSLWRLHDGALVESVLMAYPKRTTLCVSSQAGCGMACPFCATGQAGLQRNLSAAEILDQVVTAAREVRTTLGKGARLSNVVFMGMGEPLANYSAVVTAVRRLTEPPPGGLGMSARGITVSTVGLVPKMRQLVHEKLPVTLALSLHAPDDELRDELVPVNSRWKVEEAVAAAWDYARITGRRVSIEYALIRDVNDQAWRAQRLAELLNRYGQWRWAHVNLIPLNPTPGSRWTASRPADEKEFVRRLQSAGVPTTVRDTRGRDIDGACGQLAAAPAGRVGPRAQ
jgi:23S rRNA (adenine2503-C2)-methyltransferase